MSILVQCPGCHRKQSLKNVTCTVCQRDITKDRRNSKAAFWVCLKRQGKQVWERIGPSLTVARERERILKSELLRDKHIPKTQDPLLCAFWAEFYWPRVKFNKTSASTDEERWRRHLEPVFGQRRLSQITTQDVEKFKIKKLGGELRPATINRCLALLKKLLNEAAKLDLFDRANPVSRAGMLEEDNRHIARALSESDLHRLFEEMPPSSRPIVEFMAVTGIRLGNVLSLTWSQINKEARTVTLPKTKGGRKLLPLNDQALEILASLPRRLGSDVVFCRLLDGKPYVNIRDGFQNAAMRAGLGHLRLHDLRHSYASILVARGVPTEVAKELLGHTTLAMVSRYSHLGTQTLLDISNKAAPSLRRVNQ